MKFGYLSLCIPTSPLWNIFLWRHQQCREGLIFTEKHYYPLFWDNRDVSRLTTHTMQHNYTTNQAKQISLCFGSPVPRQTICRLWSRGNSEVTAHVFLLGTPRNHLIQWAIIAWGKMDKVEEILIVRLFFTAHALGWPSFTGKVAMVREKLWAEGI